jgi:formate/nitrite transporter FocA (FNT family)
MLLLYRSLRSDKEMGITEVARDNNEEVEQRLAPQAATVFETIRREGEDELERSSTALSWSGLAAGLSMGFSFVAQALLHAKLPDAPWRPLIADLGYSIGFLIVILGRQQLFTENTLTPILQLLHRWDQKTLINVARLWGFVFAANILGGFMFAWVITNSWLFDPETNQALQELSVRALEPNFWTTLLRGVFAGWLIALMVWLLPFAETARVWVIMLLTYLIGLADLAHIIAGSIEGFYALLIGQATWTDFIGAFFIPALLGNILGGVLLVAAINYAQVASDDPDATDL